MYVTGFSLAPFNTMLPWGGGGGRRIPPPLVFFFHRPETPKDIKLKLSNF